MSRMRRFALRLYYSLRPDAGEAELAREIDAHLALLREEYRRRGLPPAESDAAARRALGDVIRTKERQRDARALPWLDDLRRDAVHAVRLLARSPGFTLSALITLGLGIGASTTVLTIVYTVLLQPLPYPDSDRLVGVVEHLPPEQVAQGRPPHRSVLSQDTFAAWRERTTTVSAAGLFAPMPPLMITSTPDGPVQVSGASVSPAVFRILGARPLRGRLFEPDEERPGSQVAVISAQAWARHFQSNPGIVNRRIAIDGREYTVVGVADTGFAFPTPRTEIWTPYWLYPPEPNRVRFGVALAQLRPEATPELAAAELNALGTGARYEVVRQRDLVVAPVRPALRMLIAAVALILLLMCANLVNLLLARGAARHREISVRMALGAGRSRVARQMLTESLILSLGGGLAGAVLAVAGVFLARWLGSVNTPELFQIANRVQFGGSSVVPRLDEVTLDLRMLGLALTTAVLSGVIFGIAPAFQAKRTDHRVAVIGGHAPSRAWMPPTLRIGRLLMAVQLMMATTLLVGAALLVNSFVRLITVSVGYDPTNVLTFQLVMPRERPAAGRLGAIEAFVTRVRTIPAVLGAGFTNIPPLLPVTEFAGVFVPPGRSLESMLRDPLRPQVRAVGQGYLQAIGTRLIEGRWLDERDDGASARVMLVNQALVRRYFSGRSPVGTIVSMRRGDAPPVSWRIVGVIEDVRQARLDEEPFPIAFMDPRQMLGPAPSGPSPGNPLGFQFVAVRTSGEPAVLVPTIRRLVRELDSSAAIDSIATLESLVSGSTVRPRFYAVLLALFAAIAASLAVVGIYGVLAYDVVRRRQEIGLRLALGATRPRVLGLVLRQGALVSAAGIAIGLIGAAGASRSLAGLLYGVTPLDGLTYAVVGFAFFAVALAASYVPALRATQVDPVVALRYE